jgi:hypothetical protein
LKIQILLDKQKLNPHSVKIFLKFFVIVELIPLFKKNKKNKKIKIKKIKK